MTFKDRSSTEVSADFLTDQAHRSLIEYGQASGGSRKVAVHHLATSAAREVTARVAMDEVGADFGDAHELHIAHLVIAELATRLAEIDKPPA